MIADLQPPPTGARRLSLRVRAALLLGLFIVEIPVLAFLFDPLSINATDGAWLRVRMVLREMVPTALFFVVGLAIVLAPKGRQLAGAWALSVNRHVWRPAAVASAGLFLLLCVLTLALNRSGGDSPPWALFGVFVLGSALMTGLLGIAAAPLRFWRSFLEREWACVLLAAGAAGLATAAAVLSRQSWTFLSEATFRVSAFILSLYETDVISIPARRILGADGFKVNIAAACSGYEGVGMVIAFVSIYLWFFRRALRFPNAWLLLPIGIIAVWILNSVRIALLISIGAHVSPEIAISGFHSQAGWMMFLVVTVGLMLASYRLSFFTKSTAQPSQKAEAPPAVREALSLLAPFLAMTAVGILIAAFSVQGEALYGLKIAAGVAALWWFRGAYRLADWRGSYEALALGLLVGIAWILTDPGTDAATPPFVQTLGGGVVILWIVVRVFGTAIIVPIAEELAFRGYLHRKPIAERFETAPPAAFSWLAFFLSSALFGAIHERWLSGALAGAIFAFALYRSGRIGGAIWAHAVANAIIAAWAIAAGQWSLL